MWHAVHCFIMDLAGMGSGRAASIQCGIVDSPGIHGLIQEDILSWIAGCYYLRPVEQAAWAFEDFFHRHLIGPQAVCGLDDWTALC
jgi:hypothetical protein